MGYEHAFHRSGYEAVVRLNRIARTLREHALRRIDPTAAEAMLEVAREAEDFVYHASRPRREGITLLCEVMEEMSEFAAWRRQFEREAAVNPDALIDWFRYGFPDEKAIA